MPDRRDAYIAELEENLLSAEQALRAILTPPIHINGLSPKETKILGILLNRAPAAVTKRAIYAALYKDDPDGGPDMTILSVLICRLRKRLSPFGVHIETIWGQGWKIDKDAVEKLKGADFKATKVAKEFHAWKHPIQTP